MSKPIVAASIGFIGVRRGLSHLQFQALSRILVTQKGRGVITGVTTAHRTNDGWSGADFVRILRWVNTQPKVVLHDCGRTTDEPPPLSMESMAASWAEFSIESSSIPAWNREIVDESDVLIACPPIVDEEPRSRTWATVRYARSLDKEVVVIYPNGFVDVGGQKYFLVKDKVGNQDLYVFLGRDPYKDGYPGVPARPVILETLTNDDRLETVRPVLGCSDWGSPRYREFPSKKALRQAGFKHIGAYRICDSWEDYHFPWEFMNAPTDESEIVDTNCEHGHWNSITPGPRPNLEAPHPSYSESASQ